MNIVLSAIIVFFLMYLVGGVMRSRQHDPRMAKVIPLADFRGEIYGSGIFGRRRGSHGRLAKRENRRPNPPVVPSSEVSTAKATLPAHG
jgi:hypothetical protein